MSSSEAARKVWFVTGASSGFGRAVTEEALQKGDSVVATLRKPEMLSDIPAQYSSQLLVLTVDVKDPVQITKAFDGALKRFGRIDVVFNNAGICIISEAEGMNEEHARDMFDVLFWGAANVTKEAIKVFRESNKPAGGHLLQMSSRTALKVVPGVAHYAAAKAALECLSEGLVAELDPNWNIKISVIQPALFRTSAPLSNTIEPPHPAYSNPNFPSMKIRNLYLDKLAARGSDGDPKKLAQAMHKLAYMNDPPFYLPLHRVAVQAAKSKGEGLIQAADKYASWSDDVYFDARQG
ncbi:hypothetical protein HYDPIDRAFT_26026 [Hydnomerulius pinastri MD-312]|nr:hypothetical protein HYDPIDRAFT_26026 [Hydnomerulius pinastri MD-312]